MKMTPASLATGIFFFFHITVGILGNSSILFHYVFMITTRKHLMPKDVIIKHLTFANCLTIISKGIPETLSDLGFKYFLDDIGCKLVVYIYRIMRGMSLYAMCLLSCFQAITISPSNTRWIMFKHRATKYIGPSCSVSWLVYMLLNILTPARVLGPSYNKNVTNMVNYGYCSWFTSRNVATALYMFLLCFSDGLCLGLMACSSISMVSVLYRHKRQVKHIHSAQHFLKVSPEDQATKTILILVCTFVISYSISSIHVIFTVYFKGSGLWGVSMFIFLELCFPIYFPFVLITSFKSSCSFFLSFCKKRWLPSNIA
ncbi:vomeronasal 1 receptor, G7 [Mus musculus]|uniref:Vomeronasal type-1 receptor n=1 Tax=Mus musculus TaxID=10090 RepID=K7N608_MOUSE|nr:vomeronasal 1 receptor, G7 [Mus musculus]|eukprot:NP_598969.2 vomeronasal 1 receptor, G7 [Mus musculus]